MAGKPPRGSISPTRIALVAGVVAVTAIAVGTVVPSYCWSNCKTIEALQITPTRAGSVVGHYMMVEATMPRGVDSAGMGGACVAFKTTSNQSCFKDVDCQLPSRMIHRDSRYMSGYGPRPEFTGAYAYCSPQRTCWIKVHGDHCRKPTDTNPPSLLKVGEDNTTKEVDLLLVRAGLYGAGNGPAQIQARVIACLNGKFTPGPDVTPPCGGGPGQAKHDWSNPQPIPVP